MSAKILLPDDAVIRDILENSFLQRAGFEFVTAGPANELVSQIEEHAPALVVLDVETEGLDAAALCAQLEDDRQVLLIVPKESRQKDNEYSGIKAGAVVARPIDHQRFLTSASQLLGIFDRTPPRIETFIMVSCGSDIDELHQGWIRDINVGGAFIETRDLLPIDYKLQVQFELNGGDDLISCTARVAWVNHPDWIKCDRLPAGMGVQFIDLEEEDQKQISAFIDAQISKE